MRDIVAYLTVLSTVIIVALDGKVWASSDVSQHC